MKLNVLVVDDSALYRQLVRNVLRNVPGVEVVGVACSGHEALEKIAELKPHLLTLDVQMPGMTGVELLFEMNKTGLPVKAVMLSSLTSEGAQVTTDALLAGAFDFIQKPSSSDANANRIQLEALLTEKIEAFRESLNTTLPRACAESASRDCESIEKSSPRSSGTAQVGKGSLRATRSASPQRIDAVLIGTSTGGPIALREVIPKLPNSLGVPVLIVQHMPPKYTKSLAVRLNESSSMEVHEAQSGMIVEPNHVYIAPGGFHMGLGRQRGMIVIETNQDPPEHNCRPAVDYLFRSAADVYAGHLLAVILTGMGRDGTEGCRRIKQKGGTVIAQHPEGCVVYGMPKVIVEEELADRVVPLEKIASWIVRVVEENRKAMAT